MKCPSHVVDKAVNCVARPLGRVRTAFAVPLVASQGRRTIAAAVGFGTVLTLAACSNPPTITPEPGSEQPTLDPNASTIVIELLNTELAVGQERLAFRIRDEANRPVGPEASVQTAFYRIIPTTQEAIPAASGNAAYFGSGLPGGGSWVVYTPFDSSGTWGIDVTASRPDGWTGAVRFNLEVSGRPQTPRVGTAPPSMDSPVADGDVAAVSSDPQPDPALYAMTIGEAAESGRPTVVHFGSPAHCIYETCGPVLAEIKKAKQVYGDRVNFIHVESHDLTNPSQSSAMAAAWGLPSEPWTFILDRHGRIATRIEGGLDSVELALLLDLELQKPGGGR